VQAVDSVASLRWYLDQRCGGLKLGGMTLIVSDVSLNGIVLAADSNISSGTVRLSQERKVFRIPRLSAGLSFAGPYGIAGRPMDEWLTDFIVSDTATTGLAEFGESLAARLTEERARDAAPSRVIIHLAGYEGGTPVHRHLSNVRLLPNGHYSEPPEPTIALRPPDFGQQQWQALRHQPRETMPLHFFVNGPVQGRIAFNTYRLELLRWFQSLWTSATLPFRAPGSIEEAEDFTRTSMDVMRLLFRTSSMAATIGGIVQSLAISPRGAGDVKYSTESIPATLGFGTPLAGTG
jgi:hypothetical protein